MKNILLSLLCILSLQSMMMQAAVESKDDYQDKRQAIIDYAMQPGNYIELKKGFALLQSQGLKAPSFHDVLEQNIPQSDDEELDFDAITTQAEDIFTLNMKYSFLIKLKIAMKEKKTLNQINDPIFVYVMQNKDGFMRNTVHSWLYEWSKTKDKDGVTPLHYAASHNSLDVARMLIDAGVDINIQGNRGWTPLQYATYNRNATEVARILLDAGADLNIQDNYGNTALHLATKDNNAKFAQLLISVGADLNIRNYYGSAALHTAAFSKNTEVVRMLIAAGVDLNIQDNDGNTALHLATKDNNAKFAQLLISAGADLNIRNYYGSTPLYYAATYNRAEISCMLIAAGADNNDGKFCTIS